MRPPAAINALTVLLTLILRVMSLGPRTLPVRPRTNLPVPFPSLPILTSLFRISNRLREPTSMTKTPCLPTPALRRLRPAPSGGRWWERFPLIDTAAAIRKKTRSKKVTLVTESVPTLRILSPVTAQTPPQTDHPNPVQSVALKSVVTAVITTAQAMQTYTLVHRV